VTWGRTVKVLQVRPLSAGLLAAHAVFGGLVSAACTSAGDVAASSGPARSSLTTPPMPDPARHSDQEGATYFASHWTDLIDYGRRTLDAGPIRGLGLPSCRTCTEFVTQLDHDKAEGAHYEGGRIHFLGAEPTDVEPAKRATIRLTFEESELTVFDRRGKLTETVPADTTIFVFDLHWTDAGWRVASIKLGIEASATPTPTR
jgi:hypothetical protein